jgi:hypothetical protein
VKVRALHGVRDGKFCITNHMINSFHLVLEDSVIEVEMAWSYNVHRFNEKSTQYL